MSRLTWVGVGVAATVIAIRRGKRYVARFAPEALAREAVRQAEDLGERAQVFAAEFRRARAERERELLEALLSQAPTGTREPRARRSGEARDDDEDFLGYSF